MSVDGCHDNTCHKLSFQDRYGHHTATFWQVAHVQYARRHRAHFPYFLLTLRNWRCYLIAQLLEMNLWSEYLIFINFSSRLLRSASDFCCSQIDLNASRMRCATQMIISTPLLHYQLSYFYLSCNKSDCDKSVVLIRHLLS